MNNSKSHLQTCFNTVVVGLIAFMTCSIHAADALDVRTALTGSWIVNTQLSDKTDDKVEAAIKEAGGKPSKGFFNRQDDFYRGGPAEQELYDRISYDKVLTISSESSDFRFEYADDFMRVIHTDGRTRQTTANSFFAGGGEDFSSGNWEGDQLIVEARPRDGGFTLETYTLEADGKQLRVELVIEPHNFGAAINLVRIYDRVDD